MTAVAPVVADVSATRTALEPVREALIADARSRANQLIEEATKAAALEADHAERDANAEIERAVRRGTAAAEARANQELARARSIAYREVLEAKRDIRARVHAAVHAAALDLRNDVRYPSVVDELERLARTQLGPDTRIERDPDELGGIVGVSGARRVDYTLVALADRALESIADKVGQLWT